MFHISVIKSSVAVVISVTVLLLWIMGCTTASPLPMGTFANPDVPRGAEQLALSEDGRYIITIRGSFQVKGVYTVSGETIVFTEDEGGHCIGPGSYQWVFDGQALTFINLGDDMCSARMIDLVSGPWTMQP